MEIKSLLTILITAENLCVRTLFEEQCFAVHLLVDHLSMFDSIKLGIS